MENLKPCGTHDILAGRKLARPQDCIRPVRQENHRRTRPSHFRNKFADKENLMTALKAPALTDDDWDFV
jgi:hypothetical protein